MAYMKKESMLGDSALCQIRRPGKSDLHWESAKIHMERFMNMHVDTPHTHSKKSH